MAGRRDLDEWVDATLPRALAYALTLLRDRPAAEDVVQDCYCRLLRRADRYDLPRDGMKLLYRAITNACINRQARARPTLSLFRGEPDGGADWVADPVTPEPVAVLLGKELERAIGDGLLRLPPAQRAALELKSLGHSLQEIADALGVTASNAGVLVHRARQAMARHLAPHTEELAE